MKILALVTDAWGSEGGIAQYNSDFLSAMAVCSNSGMNITVLPRRGRPVRKHLPDNIHILPARQGRIGYMVSAVTALARDRYDLIFCGHLYHAPLAAILAEVVRIPIWLQLHGIEAWKKPGRLVRWSAERAHIVTAVSRFTRRKFIQHHQVDPFRVRIIPNTVDGRFKPGHKSREIVDRYGLKDKKIVLSVGRLSSDERYKGHEQMLRAIAEKGGLPEDVVYVVVGDGNDRSRLEGMASDLGIQLRVRFIGFVPDNELPDWYRLADVFAMPSTGEGFGIVYLQALACGVPVVAADAGGSSDPLRDGRYGRLVKGEVATAIKQIIAGVQKSNVDVAKEVHEIFGRDAFTNGVCSLANEFINWQSQPEIPAS